MFWNFCVGIHRYSAMTYDVIKSFLTRVSDKKFVMTILDWKQGCYVIKDIVGDFNLSRYHDVFFFLIFFIQILFHFALFTSLPNGKILVKTKLKAFVDHKLSPAQIISVIDSLENICHKGENADKQYFLLCKVFKKIFP